MGKLNIKMQYKSNEGVWETKHPETNINQVVGLKNKLTDLDTKSTNIGVETNTNTKAIGLLNNLQTSNKTNLVSAINETFQSGIKVNKIIVDALNSKGVIASTKDNVETNANKINKIQSGLSSGDTIDMNKLEPIIDTSTYGNSYYSRKQFLSVGFMYVHKGYLYITDIAGKVDGYYVEKYKINEDFSLTKEWTTSSTYGIAYGMSVDSNGDVYTGRWDRRVTDIVKINGQTGTVSKFFEGDDSLGEIVALYNGKVVASYGKDLILINENGSVEKEQSWQLDYKNLIYKNGNLFGFSQSTSSVREISPSTLNYYSGKNIKTSKYRACFTADSNGHSYIYNDDTGTITKYNKCREAEPVFTIKDLPEIMCMEVSDKHDILFVATQYKNFAYSSKNGKFLYEFPGGGSFNRSKHKMLAYNNLLFYNQGMYGIVERRYSDYLAMMEIGSVSGYKIK